MTTQIRRGKRIQSNGRQEKNLFQENVPFYFYYTGKLYPGFLFFMISNVVVSLRAQS